MPKTTSYLHVESIYQVLRKQYSASVFRIITLVDQAEFIEYG